MLHACLLTGIILGSFQGRLALLRTGEDIPLRIYPRQISTLPPADQAMLNAGIPISGGLELARLLEDYLS